MNEVCVVVFTCCRPNDLRKCLNSISKQTFKDFELLVIDNGDTSQTDEILISYNANIVKDKTKRLSYLFNLGWKHSKKEFIAYLADDVEIDSQWLEEGLFSLTRHPSTAVVTGPLLSPFAFSGEMHALYAKANRSRFLSKLAKFYGNFILEKKTFEPCLLCDSGSYTLGQGFEPNFKEEREVDLATTSGMLIRRSAIQAVGGFDEKFIFNHADGDLFIRLKKNGYKIIYNPRMRAVHYNRMGPSRFPFFIGRDTAYFYLKNVRPKSLRGALGAFANVGILNMYWVYKTLQSKDISQLLGIIGFIKGLKDYLMK